MSFISSLIIYFISSSSVSFFCVISLKLSCRTCSVLEKAEILLVTSLRTLPIFVMFLKISSCLFLKC